MQRYVLITALILGTAALAGCETAKGVGRDITRAAEAVDNAI